MLGRQSHDVARFVEAFASGTTGDLLEITDRQDAYFLTVVFAQLAEEHGSDRHVDAHAQRVGAADQFQHAALGELFDQQAVARQKPSVMDADAVPEQFQHFLAVRTAEALAVERLRELLLFFLAAEIEAEQALRGLRSAALREVDDVHWRAALVDQGLRRLLQHFLLIFEVERYRSLDGAHRHHLCSGALGQESFERADVPERGAHQDEADLRQREQRDLPGHAALLVGDVMKLVHHHVVHVGVAALP